MDRAPGDLTGGTASAPKQGAGRCSAGDRWWWRPGRAHRGPAMQRCAAQTKPRSAESQAETIRAGADRRTRGWSARRPNAAAPAIGGWPPVSAPRCPASVRMRQGGGVAACTQEYRGRPRWTATPATGSCRSRDPTLWCMVPSWGSGTIRVGRRNIGATLDCTHRCKDLRPGSGPRTGVPGRFVLNTHMVSTRHRVQPHATTLPVCWQQPCTDYGRVDSAAGPPATTSAQVSFPLSGNRYRRPPESSAARRLDSPRQAATQPGSTSPGRHATHVGRGEDPGNPDRDESRIHSELRGVGPHALCGRDPLAKEQPGRR